MLNSSSFWRIPYVNTINSGIVIDIYYAVYIMKDVIQNGIKYSHNTGNASFRYGVNIFEYARAI